MFLHTFVLVGALSQQSSGLANIDPVQLINVIYSLIALILIVTALFCGSVFGMLLVFLAHYRAALTMAYNGASPETQKFIYGGYKVFDGAVQNLDKLDKVVGQIIDPATQTQTAASTIKDIPDTLRTLRGTLIQSISSDDSGQPAADPTPWKTAAESMSPDSLGSHG